MAKFVLNEMVLVASFCFMPSVVDSAELSDQIETIAALPVDDDYAAYLAEQCVICHQSEQNKGTPVIQGMSKQHIIIALLLYKNGSRVNAAMTSIASGLGDEEIASVAQYFSQAKSD